MSRPLTVDAYALTVATRLDPRTAVRFERAAAACGLTRSEALRQAAALWLDHPVVDAGAAA